MKKSTYIISFLFLSLVFTSCSNMTIGFEEDSIFYTKPKTQEEKIAETKVQAKEKVSKGISRVQNSTPEVSKEHKTEDTENETTFSYDRYSGE